MSTTLPQGFIVRPPTQDDQNAIAELFIASDKADYGQADATLAAWIEWVQTVWRSPGLQLETDAWVVLAPGGRCAGYATVWHAENVIEELYCWPRIHPDYCGMGIGAYLLHQGEARARQIAESVSSSKRVTLNSWVEGVNQAAQQLLEHKGYTSIRYFWRMEIEMDQHPPVPTWPTGISVSTFKQGQDERAVFETIDEAFQDSWEYVPWTFDEWVHWEVKRDNFDSSLWFLASEGDKVAGVLTCGVEEEESAKRGWISDLAVRRPWRKQGLGLALLHQAFGACYRQGMRKCALTVDSQNLTGATRLYERAGMHRSRRYQIRYQKELRPETK